MNKESNFIEIQNVDRIWAIGSIHSNLNAYLSIQKHILANFQKNDCLIFLGNVIGLGENAVETISNIIKLRFILMAKFSLKKEKIVFLRGSQEEMFNKVLQLQLAPNPVDIVNWIFEHGVDKTIKSYGFTKNDVLNVASSGTMNISKWTTKLNNKIINNLGHKEFFLNLKHAAYSKSKKILFVNRGVDVTRPLSAQNDCFWWGYQNFSKIDVPYSTFIRIVRGYQSKHLNEVELSKNHIICTLFKQPLSNNKVIGGIFDPDGEIIDLFESK